MNGNTSPGNLIKLCLAVLLQAQACIVVAAGLGFLRNAAVEYFDEQDFELMLKNAGQVLESTSSEVSQNWSNPQSGNSGAAEVLGAFTGPDGMPCKRVRVTNKAKRTNIEDRTTYTVCKYPVHAWLLNR